MDNFIQSKLRFSRTQITKRPFAVATRAGTRSRDQHGSSEAGDSKVPEPKAVTQVAGRRAVTPIAQEYHGEEACTPSPKEVSVTFLASTPKSGRPQLARRRPFVALREVSGEESTNILRENNSSESGSSLISEQTPVNTQKRKLQLKEGLAKKRLIETRNVTRSSSSADVTSKSSKQVSVTNSTVGSTSLKSVRKGVENSCKLTTMEVASNGSTVSADTSSSRKQSVQQAAIRSIVSADTGSSRKPMGSSKRNQSVRAAKHSNVQVNSIAEQENIIITRKTMAASRKANSSGKSLEYSLQESDNKSRQSASKSSVKLSNRKVKMSTAVPLQSKQSQVQATQSSVNVSEGADKLGASKQRGSSVMDNTVHNKMLSSKQKGLARKAMETVSLGSASELTIDSSETPDKAGTRKRKTGHMRLQTDHAKRNKPHKASSAVITNTTKSTSGDTAARSITGRKAGTSGGKKTTSDDWSDQEHSRQDQMFTLMQVSGQKRKQTDISDLDVILSNIKLGVSLHNAGTMDDSDEDDNEGLAGAAVCMFEKYITKDISHQIGAIAKVQSLASRIRKAGQSVKHLQNNLLQLQTRRIGMEKDLKPGLEQREQMTSNRGKINNYLRDLKALLATC